MRWGTKQLHLQLERGECLSGSKVEHHLLLSRRSMGSYNLNFLIRLFVGTKYVDCGISNLDRSLKCWLVAHARRYAGRRVPQTCVHLMDRTSWRGRRGNKASTTTVSKTDNVWLRSVPSARKADGHVFGFGIFGGGWRWSMFLHFSTAACLERIVETLGVGEKEPVTR